MATTSPDNIRTPNAGDQYALVQDLGVMADSIQSALTKRANTFQGTAAQRTAFTSTATNGMLWQDTDGIKMIWRKDGSAWVPAVWRWSGTTTQMNSFAAPDGFKWYSTTDNSEYVRTGGAWVAWGRSTVANLVSGALNSNGWTVFTSQANWNLTSTMTSSGAWTTGIVIPSAGTYHVTASIAISATLPIVLGIKRNNTASSPVGLIASSATTGFANEVSATASRTMDLSAGDVISFAGYTSGTAGPYGLTPARTHLAVSPVI